MSSVSPTRRLNRPSMVSRVILTISIADLQLPRCCQADSCKCAAVQSKGCSPSAAWASSPAARRVQATRAGCSGQGLESGLGSLGRAAPGSTWHTQRPW